MIYSDFIVGTNHTYYVTALYSDGESSPSNILNLDIVSDKDLTRPPVSVRLLNNYPNPFNPSTTISFEITQKTEILLQIFNVKGQLVETLINNQMETGLHSVVWKSDDVSSGIYFYRLSNSNTSEIRRMILMK